MAIQLPALDIQPPQQQPGVLDQYAKAVQLKSLLGGQQLQQMQIQDYQKQIADREAMSQAYKSAFSVDPDTGAPKYDRAKLLKTLIDTGKGDLAPGVMDGFTKMDESAAKLAETQGKNTELLHKHLGEIAATAKAANYDPAMTDAAITFGELGAPQFKKDFETIRAHFKQNPNSIKPTVDSVLAGSTQQREVAAKELAAGKKPEGETPLGPKASQADKLLGAKWDAANPGQPRPPEFSVTPDSTQKDYDRINQSLQSTDATKIAIQQHKDSTAATEAQRAVGNSFRQASLDMQKQAHADAVAQKSSKPVLAFDENNKAHLLPMGDAQAAGYKGIIEATPKQVEDAKTHAVVLNDMQQKLNDVVDARGALDQNVGQRLIISKVLSHSEPGIINDTIRNTALKGATQKTRDYIQSALSLKESALGLPKEITGGSRTSEIQGAALFQTLPSGSSVDSKYALEQAQKFQANIDRLHGRVAEVRGMDTIAPHPDLGGKAKPATTTSNVPANVSKALANTGPGIHKLSDGSSWMKDADGTITKQ